jgi:hypothetical protein
MQETTFIVKGRDAFSRWLFDTLIDLAKRDGTIIKYRLPIEWLASGSYDKEICGLELQRKPYGDNEELHIQLADENAQGNFDWLVSEVSKYSYAELKGGDTGGQGKPKTKRKPFDQLKPETQETYRQVYSVVIKTRKAYRALHETDENEPPEPNIDDLRVAVADKGKRISERTLHTIMAYGDANEIITPRKARLGKGFKR